LGYIDPRKEGEGVFTGFVWVSRYGMYVKSSIVGD
jgi:hypothetical protein